MTPKSRTFLALAPFCVAICIRDANFRTSNESPKANWKNIRSKKNTKELVRRKLKICIFFPG